LFVKSRYCLDSCYFIDSDFICVNCNMLAAILEIAWRLTCIDVLLECALSVTRSEPVGLYFKPTFLLSCVLPAVFEIKTLLLLLLLSFE
jgi:hypothetical protein